jgi:hypothetical protein
VVPFTEWAPTEAVMKRAAEFTRKLDATLTRISRAP